MIVSKVSQLPDNQVGNDKASGKAGKRAKAKRTDGAGECLTMNLVTAGKLLGLNRNGSYAAAARGEIPVIKFGKRLLVPKVAFQRMLERVGAVEQGDNITDASSRAAMTHNGDQSAQLADS